MEPIYGYDTSIYKYIIVYIYIQVYNNKYTYNILRDCQNCSKHVSLSHCWHHSSIQLSALITFVCRSSRAQLSLCQPKPSQCLWSQVANSMANWMRAHGAPMCTLPISCPMVQNVRSRNFYGHSCLALCTNSIKCLPSKRPKCVCIRRSWWWQVSIGSWGTRLTRRSNPGTAAFGDAPEMAPPSEPSEPSEPSPESAPVGFPGPASWWPWATRGCGNRGIFLWPRWTDLFSLEIYLFYPILTGNPTSHPVQQRND